MRVTIGLLSAVLVLFANPARAQTIPDYYSEPGPSPVRDYLNRQGRFAHFTEDDIAYFQSKVDEMWDHWLVPGVIPFRKQLEEDRPPA